MCKTILNWIFAGRVWGAINIFSAEQEMILSFGGRKEKKKITSEEIRRTKLSKRIKLCSFHPWNVFKLSHRERSKHVFKFFLTISEKFLREENFVFPLGRIRTLAKFFQNKTQYFPATRSHQLSMRCRKFRNLFYASPTLVSVSLVARFRLLQILNVFNAWFHAPNCWNLIKSFSDKVKQNFHNLQEWPCLIMKKRRRES